jgi:hypothetical protein
LDAAQKPLTTTLLLYYITLRKKKTKKLKLIMVLLFQFWMQHTDSFDCGLLQCGGNEHFMVFNIDDFSKYNYVYLIKDKSDEFERFKEFF